MVWGTRKKGQNESSSLVYKKGGCYAAMTGFLEGSGGLPLGAAAAAAAAARMKATPSAAFVGLAASAGGGRPDAISLSPATSGVLLLYVIR